LTIFSSSSVWQRNAALARAVRESCMRNAKPAAQLLIAAKLSSR
jgi:hypothetical protein